MSFQVGDVVVCVNTHYPQLKLGQCYIINFVESEVCFGDKLPWVQLEGWCHPNPWNRFMQRRFKLAMSMKVEDWL